MEDTLTDCMVRVKEDLSQLKKLKDYLRTKTEAEEGCSFTWRTLEGFNSLLSVCSSQNSPETNALDILLDSFYYFARNNTDSSAWDNFGFELGIICVKVLSAIERSDSFEVLFSKLLSVITVLSKHNSGIWKAAARQILNVMINKKFSLHYLEESLKSYIFIIRNVESTVLYDFSSRNLGLLKTLSLLVQRVGDYEIQFDIVCMIFLHLSNNTKLMSGFFTATESKFFHSLQFSDFEGDCRVLLNALNRQYGEPERKVYSICCHSLYLGGCFVEPPMGRSCIWMDANKDTERVSFKCGDITSNTNRVIFVRFSEVVNVIYKGNTEGLRRVIIQTKSLKGMNKDLRNDDICLVTEKVDGTLDFVRFLEAIISERKRKRHGGKASKTVDSLFIDIKSSKEVQDYAITSSNRSGIDHMLSDAFSLPEKVNQTIPNNEMEKKSAQHLKVNSKEARTSPQRGFAGKNTFFESQELSPKSFTESLHKRLGLDSPESKRTFEDSAQTVDFFQNDPLRRSHKLFRSPDNIFSTFDGNKPENLTLDEDKENKPPVAMEKPSISAHIGKSQNIASASHSSTLVASRTGRSYGSQKALQGKSSSTQSQDYFRGGSNFIIKKRPSLPKLKRSKKATSKQFTKENKSSPNFKDKYFSRNNAATVNIGDLNKTQSSVMKFEQQRKDKGKIEVKGKKAALPVQRRKSSDTGKEKQTEVERTKVYRKKMDRRQSEAWRQKTQSGPAALMPRVKGDSDVRGEDVSKLEVREDAKPSLLDPNGYAYKRWCEPTKSERSNFWLEKLKAVQKPNTNSNVFEFSEDLDSVAVKSIKKRKTVPSRRLRGRENSKRTLLWEAKKFLKKTPLLSLEKQKAAEVYGSRMRTPEASRSPRPVPHAEESTRSKTSVKSFHSYRTSKSNSPESLGQKNAVNEYSKGESVTDEDEEPMLPSKKREQSVVDISAARTCTEEKLKTAKLFSSKVFLSILRCRLQRAEERDRQQTDKIMRTVRESFDLLVERVQTKDGERTRACMESTQAAAAEAQEESEDLGVHEKRTRKTILYFRAACSVSDRCKALEEQFTKARGFLQDWRAQKSAPEAAVRVGDRLTNLIKSEMESTIMSEWTWQRDLVFGRVFRRLTKDQSNRESLSAGA